MGRRQTFWYTIKRHILGHDKYGKSGSSMHHEDNTIFYEHNVFDPEDDRTYSYCFSFGIGEYKRALKELIETGHATISRKVEDIEPLRTFSMDKKGNSVSISFYGYGGSTPGGSPVYGTVRDSYKFLNLLLWESRILKIESLAGFMVREDDSTLPCPACKSDMIHKGYQTADPWPEEEGPLYPVDAYYCKECDQLYAYWEKYLTED